MEAKKRIFYGSFAFTTPRIVILQQALKSVERRVQNL